MSSKSIQVLDTTEELNFPNKSVKERCLSVSKQQFCFVLLMRFLVEIRFLMEVAGFCLTS